MKNRNKELRIKRSDLNALYNGALAELFNIIIFIHEDKPYNEIVLQNNIFENIILLTRNILPCSLILVKAKNKKPKTYSRTHKNK